MVWFRSLIRFSVTKSSSSPSITPRTANPFGPYPSPTLSWLAVAAAFSSGPPSAAAAQEPPVVTPYAGLAPTKAGEKPRVVVLGSGWAGCRLMKGLDTKTYDVVCVSPRNHMVFTPLLASTCVGTLEFRSVAEPIGRIQPAISREPGSYFFLAKCTGLDTDKHEVFF